MGANKIGGCVLPSWEVFKKQLPENATVCRLSKLDGAESYLHKCEPVGHGRNFVLAVGGNSKGE